VKQWLRLMAMIGREFWDDGCLMRASALTYSTLLSIIPLLALTFSVLKGMGVQNALRPLVLEKLAAGSEEIVAGIVDYINNTDVSHLGTIGLFFLVVSVLALITTIEEVFNEIWGVKETRTLYRRFADFFSVITIGPIFLLAAITMTSTLESQTFVRALMDRAVVGQAIVLLFQVLPYVVMWAAFTGLYIFVPNTRVSLRAAVIGGIFGGTLWQIAEWGYFSLQFGVARYNAIYGAMAVVPIFMVWIYVSWLIVLLGLEVTYVAQHLSNVPSEQFELRGRNVSFASRELAALTVLTAAAEAFQAGEPPRTVECFAAEVGLPPRLARSVVEQLLRLKLLCEVEADGGRTAYQPARSPESMPLAAVLEALREDGISHTQLRASHGRDTVLALEERVRRSWRTDLAGLTVRDLVLDESGKDAMEEEKTARDDAPPV
jgi:membrane protein